MRTYDYLKGMISFLGCEKGLKACWTLDGKKIVFVGCGNECISGGVCRMLSDLKRRIVAKERVLSQLADGSVLPKSIWGRILNERPAASGRLYNGRYAENLLGYENLLVRGLELPVDIVKHILEALRKLRRNSTEAMEAWIAERSVGRIVVPQSGHDVNPSSWGHWLWRNMLRDSPSHLQVPRRRWQPEGGVDGGPYWWQTETIRDVDGPWGLTAPWAGVLNTERW